MLKNFYTFALNLLILISFQAPTILYAQSKNTPKLNLIVRAEQNIIELYKGHINLAILVVRNSLSEFSKLYLSLMPLQSVPENIAINLSPLNPEPERSAYLHFTFSFSIEALGNPTLSNYVQSSDGDAFSIVAYDNNNKASIHSFILMDRILFKDKDFTQEYPDAQVRLITALGHEIYGNLLSFSEQLQNNMPSESIQNSFYQSNKHLFAEVNAFTKGVEFLNLVLKQKNIELPSFIREQTEQALKREQSVLNRYLQRLNDDKSCADKFH